MNRTFSTATTTLALLTLGSCQQKEENIQKPNILFIYADDLGYHDLSIMRSDYYETPNIDRIAAEGIIFTNGYANCQVCSPSRASIMLGKFPPRHGITDWKLIHYYEDGREELYNLKSDLEETTNLALGNPVLANQLSEQLFDYLHKVGARFPVKDPEYNEDLERKHLERIVNERLPQLEKQRLNFLREDFNPGNNWWGSDVKKD